MVNIYVNNARIMKMYFAIISLLFFIPLFVFPYPTPDFNITQNVTINLLKSNISGEILSESDATVIGEVTSNCGNDRIRDAPLKSRRIFFTSIGEGDIFTEISSDNLYKANKYLLDAIGYNIDECPDKEVPDGFMFPAYYSFDNKTLKDIYVYVTKREECAEGAVSCSKPLGQNDQKDNLEKMLENYFDEMPRVHAGNEPLTADDETNKCLDERGYAMEKFPRTNVCMSLWLARRDDAHSYNIDYYAGRLELHQVDQTNYLMDENTSFVYYLYDNKKFCELFHEDLVSYNGMDFCYAFLSDGKYAMLCCCHGTDVKNCHLPNPASITHSRQDNLMTGRDRPEVIRALQKSDVPMLSCVFGTVKYELSDSDKPLRWIDLTKGKEIGIGERCKITYLFNGSDSRFSLTVKMSSASPDECVIKPEHYVCNLERYICPGEMPSLYSFQHFEVTCCCGDDGIDTVRKRKTNNRNKSKDTYDLCNLNLLQTNISTRIKSIMERPLCQSTTIYQRMFGRHWSDISEINNTLCYAYHDFALNQNVYLLDGNNIDFLFDEHYSSHVDVRFASSLVIGHARPAIYDPACDYSLYGQLSDLDKYRIIYVHKCNPLGPEEDKYANIPNAVPPTGNTQCDGDIISNLTVYFEQNKEQVMRKCLKYVTRQPVAKKDIIEKALNSKKVKYVYADETFFCYTYIKSTIWKKRNKKLEVVYNQMNHTIEAGPVPKTRKESYPGESLPPDFHRWCLSIVNRVANRNSVTQDGYCVYKDENGTDLEFQENHGNYDGNYFCCCFVGLGWESCDIRKQIVRYVDSYDLRRTVKDITEVVHNQTCEVENYHIYDNNLTSPYDHKHWPCLQNLGCFTLANFGHIREKADRFEIWSGCISNIDKMVLFTARMRLAYLCQTNYFPRPSDDKPKCMAVDLGKYIADTEKFKMRSERYPTGEDGPSYALVCCCKGNCKMKNVKEEYGRIFTTNKR